MTYPVIRLPSSLQLQAFEMVAVLGNVAKAACLLGVGASALAKRLAALEQLVGEALFMRDSSALMLTKAGQQYLDQIRPLMAMLRAAPQHHFKRMPLPRSRALLHHAGCGRHAPSLSHRAVGEAEDGESSTGPRDGLAPPGMHEPLDNWLRVSDIDWRSAGR